MSSIVFSLLSLEINSEVDKYSYGLTADLDLNVDSIISQYLLLRDNELLNSLGKLMTTSANVSDLLEVALPAAETLEKSRAAQSSAGRRRGTVTEPF